MPNPKFEVCNYTTLFVNVMWLRSEHYCQISWKKLVVGLRKTCAWIVNEAQTAENVERIANDYSLSAIAKHV